MLKRHHDRISPLKFFQATFDDKMQAVKDSKENNSNVIEEYQVTSQLASQSIISSDDVLIQKANPTEGINDKLHAQENEIRLLKELIMNGFKGIEKISFHLRKESSNIPTASTVAEDNETSRSEVTPGDANADTENKIGPELPLPVPNLFQTLPYMVIFIVLKYRLNVDYIVFCVGRSKGSSVLSLP